MKYSTLFLDMDDTILSFKKASIQAFDLLCHDLKIQNSKKLFHRYEIINLSYWKKLEKQETTLEELSVKRFDDLFEEFNIDANSKVAADCYFYHLKYQHQPMPYMRSTLKLLRKQGYRMYITTNGNIETQIQRYHDAKLDQLTDGMFISDLIGYKKPDKRYFEYILKEIDVNPKEVLVVGDSLSSDIQGGINANLDTCWFTNKIQETTIKPNYIIHSLKDLFIIL